MIARFLDAMRMQAQRTASTSVISRIGIVTSFDPDTFSVRVNVQPEQIISGWLPLNAYWIGNGWGMFATPNVGDMVAVQFLDGDFDAGVVIARFYNDVDRPLSVQSGEFWLVHASGQFVKLTNDGRLQLNDGHGAIINLNGDGTIASQATQWAHQGPVSINGDVAVTGNETVTGTVTATTDVVGGGKSLKSHVHTGVQSGGSNTGPPA